MATNKTTRMDAQGRVILPPHIRKELNLNAGQLVTVSLEGGTIQIRPAEDRCELCGETPVNNFIIGHKVARICKNCAKTIAARVKKEDEIND